MVVRHLTRRWRRSSSSFEAIQIQAEVVDCCSLSRRPAETPGKLENLGIDWIPVFPLLPRMPPWPPLDPARAEQRHPKQLDECPPVAHDDQDHGGGRHRRPDDMSISSFYLLLPLPLVILLMLLRTPGEDEWQRHISVEGRSCR